MNQGNYQEALNILIKSLNLSPENPETIFQTGKCLLFLNQYKRAISYFELLLKLEKDFSRAWKFTGFTYYAFGNYEMALHYLKKSINLEPDDKETNHNLGLTYLSLHKTGPAIEHFNTAISLDTGFFNPCYSLAVTYYDLKDFTTAKIYLKKSILLNPSLPEPYKKLALLEIKQKKILHAVFAYTRFIIKTILSSKIILKIKLSYTSERIIKTSEKNNVKQPGTDQHQNTEEIHFNLGCALMNLNQPEYSIKNFELALKANPKNYRALTYLFSAKQMICDWHKRNFIIKKLLSISNQHISQGLASPVLPLISLYLPLSPEQQLEIIRSQARNPANTLSKKWKCYKNKRLRIGYISGSFMSSPTGILLQDFFKYHNRQEIELYIYSLGIDDKSIFRNKIKDSAEHFIDLSFLTTEECKKRILNDKIQILIDLQGHSNYRKDPLQSKTDLIPALKPAPVQVFFHGHSGTTGSKYIDYLVTNKIICPPEQAPFYTEKLVYLPDSAFANSYKDLVIPQKTCSKTDYNLPEDKFIFCCFNNSYKIEPLIFKIWINILKRVPHSLLWIQSINDTMKVNLYKELQKRKIQNEQLVFCEKTQKIEDHFSRLKLADLFLDTHYYNAHTTAADSLWNEVPLITWPGKTSASRVAASMLINLGLPELITGSAKEYEDLAVALATNKQFYNETRNKLKKNKLTFPLFNTAQMVKNLETACKKMWALHKTGAKPGNITI
ncbi:MAG: tetratricopeptide repeat protein [bacterium]|nr:tetratricopeptide repeat protein [bacterium]